MNYRELGKTGLMVGEISLGCAGYEEREREPVCSEIDYAIERGINFMDMFASDPALRSNVGAAIAGKRDRIIIQGHIGSAWQNGQYLRTRDMNLTRESFDDQLERLGTDYLDVGMIHYVDSPEDWNEIEKGPFLEYVLSLKESGRIRHIGLSSHNPHTAMKAVESGIVEVLMFAVNPCYDMQPGGDDVEKLWADESYADSLHNQDENRKRLYETCESRGIGIDVMKAYGGGDLLSAELSPFGRAFTPVQCIHYALTRPSVSAVMIGARSTEHLDAALAYLSAAEEERDYSTILSGLDRFTFSGHCLYCGHCAPCSAGIDVAAVTKYLNLCTAQGFVPETERDHYRLLAHHAGECIECGSCESNCPFGVGIIENMKKAETTFGY